MLLGPGQGTPSGLGQPWKDGHLSSEWGDRRDASLGRRWAPLHAERSPHGTRKPGGGLDLRGAWGQASAAAHTGDRAVGAQGPALAGHLDSASSSASPSPPPACCACGTTDTCPGEPCVPSFLSWHL